MKISMMFPTLLACTALVGCTEPGSTPAASFEGEGWIDTSPPGPPSPKPPIAGGEDEDDDEGEGGVEAFWTIYGTYANGTYSEVGGEFFAEDALQELCGLSFPVTVVETLDSCSECTAAWTFEFGEAEREIDNAGGCNTYGPSQVAGLRFSLGITSDNLLLRDRGDGWEEFGESFVEEGELILEWFEGEEGEGGEDEDGE
ncbi:MAG: hypothetical protein AAF799_28375 [Myxococcota bacterium]